MRKSTLVVILACGLVIVGCNRRRGSDSEGGNPLGANAVGPGTSPAQSHIRRGAERMVDQNLLDQIALVCFQYGLENNGRCPASKEELIGLLKGFPGKYIQALQEDWIVFVPKARTDSNMIILYEKHVFQASNNRLVAYGDRHVKLLSEPEFQEAKKAQGF
jgi:hypothetical protein